MCVDITPYAQLSPMPTFINYVTFSYFSLFHKKLVKSVFLVVWGGICSFDVTEIMLGVTVKRLGNLVIVE